MGAKPVNCLLANLPDELYQRLSVHLELVELPQHKVLYHPGDRFEYAYFPISSVVSNVATMENGSTVEIGLIGKEGMVGLPIIFRTDYIISSSWVVQLGGNGLRITAQKLQKEIEQSEILHDFLMRYVQGHIIQISQTAACNSYHKIEQRFARWLLLVRDSIQKDKFYLTQEFIAQMLGVRRSGVTEVASKFQKAGIIHYNRGLIQINSHEQLESYSCECYKLVKNEFDRIVRIQR